MPGELRAPLVTLDPLAEGTANIRGPLVTAEPLAEGTPALRDSLVTLDPLAEGSPNLRSDLVTVDALSEGFRNLRITLLIIEALHPIEPEGTVSTELFPGSPGSSISLPGLTFTVHKRPRFATSVHMGSSGVSVRRSMMQYPIWEFEFTYEFLEDRTGAASSLKSLMGFFLARQGQFDTFLYKDPDDYLVTQGVLATADGTTTQFPFKRTMGPFAEKVGQVDTGNTITIYGTVLENRTIPAVGPYTITTTHAAAFVEDLGVTKAGVPMTKVGAGPAAGQYSVAAGVYTFNSADFGAAVVIHYRYTIAPAAYTVTLPNLVVFLTAPASGTVLSADFQFFFNCRFQEDMADFEKFADKFWELQQIVIETVPQ